MVDKTDEQPDSELVALVVDNAYITGYNARGNGQYHYQTKDRSCLQEALLLRLALLRARILELESPDAI